ncbi:hypothetical protein Si128_02041 [Streptococcus infantarius subsp. infantarius]|nr:hypothetical protein [Streptococcus infantarius subsp. infantarius]MCO4558015.1 hypothetical protein [Streptococcus infantarius subsp. infantarius]MCO4576440.1 hypothetical protein [Streptococcus infantarius subsp. infantarius]
MEINSEIYDNLYDFIQNLEIRIQKNVFHSNHSEQLSTFSSELFQLCKTKELNVLLNDITSLPSYEELIFTTPDQSKGYILMSVENFYTEIIEPSKIEYYG